MRYMKFGLVLVFIALFQPFFAKSSEKQKDSLAIERKIDKLLSTMTIDEKTAQMNCIFINSVLDWNTDGKTLDENKLKKYIVDMQVGSIVGAEKPFSKEGWLKVISSIGALKNKHNIPVLFGVDAVRGFTYCENTAIYPFNLALAATRNPEFARKMAELTAADLRSVGIRWNFSPVLDLGIQPLWPRFIETFGEDPYLATTMGLGCVSGYEKDRKNSNGSIASCLKHFYGYSNPEVGKDRTPAYIPDIMLREYYLPTFKAAIRAGARTIMVNSGELNGIPVHANKKILTDLLRNELKFKGMVVSDIGDVEKLNKFHRVAPTLKDAVKLAVDAGIDMSMGTEKFSGLLAELVREGKITEKRVDESVRRILRLKYELGLFDNIMPTEHEKANFASPESFKLALQASKESMVLLKNESGILPFKKESKILVAGVGAKKLTSLVGSWSYSWQGDKENLIPASVKSIFSELQENYGAKIKFAETGSLGCKTDLVAMSDLAKDADCILLCLGEEPYAEATGNTNDLMLPDNQRDLALTLAKTGKPVVLILTTGRPLIIREIEPYMSAFLYAFWPGPQGSKAISEVLYGDFNPCGKLPFTYPKYPNDMKPYYHKYSDVYLEHFIPKFSENEKGFDPQYPFGFGLSYTTFRYDSLKISTKNLKGDENLKISIRVTNSGNRAGKEVIELYTRDLYASIAPPVKRLRRFSICWLNPGETKLVDFTINKNDLKFVNADLNEVVEAGDFDVIVSNIKEQFNYQLK